MQNFEIKKKGIDDTSEGLGCSVYAVIGHAICVGGGALSERERLACLVYVLARFSPLRPQCASTADC